MPIRSRLFFVNQLELCWMGCSIYLQTKSKTKFHMSKESNLPVKLQSDAVLLGFIKGAEMGHEVGVGFCYYIHH